MLQGAIELRQERRERRDGLQGAEIVDESDELKPHRPQVTLLPLEASPSQRGRIEQGGIKHILGNKDGLNLCRPR